MSRKGMEPSALVASSILYTLVYGVDVLQEAIFVCCFDDHKSVIHMFFHRLGGLGDVLRTLASEFSIYKLATMGLIGNPWQLLPVDYSTCPGIGNMYSLCRIPTDK